MASITTYIANLGFSAGACPINDIIHLLSFLSPFWAVPVLPATEYPVTPAFLAVPSSTVFLRYLLKSFDAACNSFGQTINVNMMQMMAAYCSIINGGMLYQPHIVKRIESANGEVVKEYKANLVRQTITASTSKLLRRYLKNTVEEGTAKKAGVTGIHKCLLNCK